MGLQLLKIVVSSDQHLGYENADKTSFSKFLDGLRDDSELTDLVLLGDVVDMWRRDSSGVFLENWDIVTRIKTLADRVRVHYVAGNHDFHVLRLQAHGYPFQFVKNLRLADGDCNYRFVHGYEFDPMQEEPIMEALCRVMSDEGGSFETGTWAALTEEWSDLRFLFSALFKKNSIRNQVESVRIRPEDRLRDTLDSVEKSALASKQPGEVLVFGHTHHPFINPERDLVNSGSWVKDAPIHNTYVEISNGTVRLLTFDGNEINP